MILGKKRKLGRRIEEITVGEKLTLTEKMEDKDLLLYLGLTNDSNPLYIQHDYASQTPYKKPVVPSIMLIGIVTSAVSKYLPGPGSHITGHEIRFLKPVYHYGIVTFYFEVIEVNQREQSIIVSIYGENAEKERVLEGKVTVTPPYPLEQLNGTALDNF